ncbi:MAG: hypothetical protein JO152_01010 [Mycobacteriaceae bacterium]|nr:hypothetical protein [Mycobacteriaceae bacterium]
MASELDDFTPWTAAGAARLVAAGEALAQAVRDHAAAIAALVESGDATQVFGVTDALIPAVLAYGDAQFDFTGNGFPFGALAEFLDDEDDEDDDNEPQPADGTAISVLSRHDYLVASEDDVLAAGRAAYARV